MSEQKVDSVQPDALASGDTQEATQTQTDAVAVSDEPRKDSVKYDTYQRTLSEAKKAKARLAELEAANAELEQRQLESEGKKDELIEKLKAQVAQTNAKLKDSVGNFAYQSIQSQIHSEALKSGCVDVDALTKLVDLDALDFDDSTFKADPGQVKMLVDEAKKTRPYLFSKRGPAIESHIPNTTVPGEKPISELSNDELVARIKAIHAKQKSM